jgi:hypothetical protein
MSTTSGGVRIREARALTARQLLAALFVAVSRSHLS